MLPWGQSGSGTGCLEMFCSLCSWRFSTLTKCSLVWPQSWPSCEQEVGLGTFRGPSQPQSACDPVPTLQQGHLKSLFAFSAFWSQINSGIKSSTIRKSRGVVLTVSALRSEHYDKEHDAGGDSSKLLLQSLPFSQATGWQAILLFFSLEEMRQGN